MHPDRSGRSLLVTRSYSQLSKSAKKNFLSSTKAVVDIVLEFLAGPDADEVRTKLFLEDNRKLISPIIYYCNNSFVLCFELQKETRSQWIRN